MKSIHNEAASSSLPSQALEQLWRLTLLLGDAMAEGLAERRLTIARAGLVWELQQRGPVTQRALSQALRVTPRNVTGLVDALEADGLAERAPHPGDRRASLVRLTSKGQALAAALRREQDAFADYLFGDLSNRDQAQAAKLLARLVERVRSAVESYRYERAGHDLKTEERPVDPAPPEQQRETLPTRGPGGPGR